eukprot:SAG31_NODE_5900_length_2264_cov_4.540878_3_plen_263_part_00
MTGLVTTVASHFKAALPSYQISFWLGLAAEQRPAAFNLTALSAAVDVMALMAYDLVSNASAVAGPEVTLSFLSSSIERLIQSEGVEATKIVVGFGWRATGYSCKELDPATKTCTCRDTQVYKGRTACSGERHGYFWGLAQLAKSATPPGELRWSEAKQASYFNVAPNASCPKEIASNPACPWGWNEPSFNATNGNKWTVVRQVWLDGPRTLAPRYDYVRNRGLRGVTMWTTSGVCCWPPYTMFDVPQAEAAMWKAIRDHFLY